ncbi:MAG: RNA 3'-terminal phosphate cyclase [Thermoprotei archaeon]
MIEIDGSFGEGGGQMLRTALGLSAALQQPFIIKNIRSKRRKPGLQTQHLNVLDMMEKLTNAEVSGKSLGSTEVFFFPREKPNGDLKVNPGTAASISLMIQPLLIASISSNSIRLLLSGGTDVPLSPRIDYVTLVEIPILRQFGVRCELNVMKRGYYPLGGGVVDFRLNAWVKPDFMDIVRGELTDIYGVSSCSSLPEGIAVRQANSAADLIKRKIGLVPRISIEHYSFSAGSSITLVARLGKALIGSDALGLKGKPAEIVGEQAAQGLIDDLLIGSSVDRYMADALVPFIALVGGSYTIPEFTEHVKSNLYVVEKFLGKRINVTEEVSASKKIWRLYANKVI